jgi:hypothetical protein
LRLQHFVGDAGVGRDVIDSGKFLLNRGHGGNGAAVFVGNVAHSPLAVYRAEVTGYLPTP